MRKLWTRCFGLKRILEFFGYTTPTQIVQWSKKLKPSNIKGIPVKASFQLLGGFALVSTSQQFSCATSWMTLKTFFVFFLGAIAKAGKTMPLTHIYLLWNQTSALTRHMFINHNDKSIISPKGAQEVIVLANSLLLEHQFGWCFLLC